MLCDKCKIKEECWKNYKPINEIVGCPDFVKKDKNNK